MNHIPPLPTTLRPKLAKTLFMLLVSAVFVFCGFLMVRDGNKLGYFCGGFFALGILVGVVQLHPRSSYLLLTENEFTFCSLFRAYTVPWEKVECFAVIKVGFNPMVGWNYRPTRETYRAAPNLSKSLCGYEAALPDTYGMKPEELAALLNGLRNQAVARFTYSDRLLNREDVVGKRIVEVIISMPDSPIIMSSDTISSSNGYLKLDSGHIVDLNCYESPVYSVREEYIRSIERDIDAEAPFSTLQGQEIGDVVLSDSRPSMIVITKAGLVITNEDNLFWIGPNLHESATFPSSCTKPFWPV